MRNTYSIVDIAKLFFSICVVAIHSNIFQNNTNFLEYSVTHSVFRIAVPFFFVCSGYFLGSKINELESTNCKVQEIKKYIRRLSIPFVFWMIVGIVRQIYDLRNENILILIRTIIKKVIFYPWGALWYILAVIVALTILMPFIKRGKIKYAVFLGGILYIFALLCNNYYFLAKDTFISGIIDFYMRNCISARNGVFVGLLFVSIGIYLSEYVKKRDIKLRKIVIIFIFSYIFLFLEICIIFGKPTLDDNALFISFVILIPYLLVILLRCSDNIRLKINTKVLRNYSTGIYLMHRPILDFIYLAKIELSCYELFFTVIIVCVIILTILYKINNKYINLVIK